jgi:hypothetical protein
MPGVRRDGLHGRRTACSVKGAKPGDLPTGRPTEFEAAKAIGLTIPPSLLQRAEQPIE